MKAVRDFVLPLAMLALPGAVLAQGSAGPVGTATVEDVEIAYRCGVRTAFVACGWIDGI